MCHNAVNWEWVGPTVIGAGCHINPSLGQYVETDTSTGKVIRDLLGYGFTRSPDGKTVVHGGWVPHFSPPYAKSDYLQFDAITVYPAAGNTVRREGSKYIGIHEIQQPFTWSADSKTVSFVDCTYDWLETDSNTGEGEESNRRCFNVTVDAAAASPAHQPRAPDRVP